MASVDLAMQDRGNLPDLVGELGKFFREDRLHAIGESLVWLVMDFDEQAVGSNGDRSTR